MNYHREKDILRTMKKMGHRNTQNTLIYTHLVDFKDDNWNVKVAHDVNEASEFVKTGFEYVTGDYNDGGKIFRKRV